MQKPDTRQQILDTAIELFWKKSYHAVNMNELARAAGVNKATIYQHFASKDDLAVAAIARAAEHTEAHVYQASFDEAEQPADRLGLIFSKAHAMHAAICAREGRCRGCPFMNIGVELATMNDEVRHAVNTSIAGFTRFFRRIADSDETADALMALMNAGLISSKLQNDPSPILAARAQALRLLST